MGSLCSVVVVYDYRSISMLGCICFCLFQSDWKFTTRRGSERKEESKNENSSEIKTQEKWEMYDFQPIPKYKKTEQIRNTNQR